VEAHAGGTISVELMEEVEVHTQSPSIFTISLWYRAVIPLTISPSPSKAMMWA
jgi:hypothetical protein